MFHDSYYVYNSYPPSIGKDLSASLLGHKMATSADLVHLLFTFSNLKANSLEWLLQTSSFLPMSPVGSKWMALPPALVSILKWLTLWPTIPHLLSTFPQHISTSFSLHSSSLFLSRPYFFPMTQSAVQHTGIFHPSCSRHCAKRRGHKDKYDQPCHPEAYSLFMETYVNRH